MYRKFLKQCIDFVVSLIGFIILLPIFIFVVIILFIANQGKPFFFQYRPGKHEKIFKVIKFKTMNDKKNKEGNLLPDEKRLTATGKFIRKTSLDEIPQLLNVIKGDMSLIGPRPLLVEYLPLYNDCQKRRHEVKPGITGWAQVNGRNAIGWEKKFAYDCWYVDHMSFLLDAKIFFLTIKKVFKSEGISSETASTMEKFTGSIPEKRSQEIHNQFT
ncbi:MAG: sugar transferase [Ginsengibacter sp.]